MSSVNHEISKALNRHLDHSPLAHVEWSAEFRITFWSKKAEALFGWRSEEVLGQRSDEFKFVYESDVAEVDEIIDELRDARGAKNFSFNRNYRKDGSVVECEWYNSVVTDASGAVVSIQSLVLDVTERYRTLREVKAAEERFRRFAEMIPQLVWSADLKGNATYFNPRWSEFVDGDLSAMAGWGWMRVLHPDDVGRTDAAWKRTLETGAPYEVEYRFKNLKGEYRWHLGRAVPVRNETGEIIQWLGSCTDIHDQKMALDELAKTKSQLERTLIEARSANELKSAFLANMSHEIRTPLGAVLGFTELLRDEDLSREEREEYFEVIARNGRQLASLINDILDLSKVEAGHLKVESIEIPLRKLILEVVADMQPRAIEKQLELCAKLDPEVPEVVVSDPIRLKQILTNVVSNALKFTQRGRVEIRARAVCVDGKCALTIEVEDTGVGISPNQAGRLFQPFTQADDSTTRKFGGTGLGLLLSRRLCGLLGGTVQMKRSQLGVGSTFEIAFPEIAVAKELSVHSPGAASESFDAHDLRGRQILLVEDAPDNQELMKRILTKRGAQVEIASNGAEGVEMARSMSFDCILMDVQMPVMDGYTAMGILQDERYPTPVIALTAHAMAEIKERCLQLGCFDYLAKPVTPKDLLEKTFAACKFFDQRPRR